MGCVGEMGNNGVEEGNMAIEEYENSYVCSLLVAEFHTTYE